MGQHITIPTSGTQCIGAYMAQASGSPKGGLVVIQEIFGVNAHVRSVVDRFAALGYTAIAPAFFDHLETDVQLGYDRVGVNKGKKLVGELSWDQVLEDVASAAQSIASAGKIGTVGYCWGGTVAMLSAIRLGLPSVSYYGARNLPFLHEVPQAPVMFHFGEKDQSITQDMVEKHRQALPQMEVFTYPADHAFNRDGSKPYDEASAKLALQRSMAFVDTHLASA